MTPIYCAAMSGSVFVSKEIKEKSTKGQSGGGACNEQRFCAAVEPERTTSQE